LTITNQKRTSKNILWAGGNLVYPSTNIDGRNKIPAKQKENPSHLTTRRQKRIRIALGVWRHHNYI
jgi:hypothetical protein